MHINGVEIEDTFAEAFGMWGSRLIVTGDDLGWARTAAEAATGFATSIIGCGCEAGTNDLAPAPRQLAGRQGVGSRFAAPADARGGEARCRLGRGARPAQVVPGDDQAGTPHPEGLGERVFYLHSVDVHEGLAPFPEGHLRTPRQRMATAQRVGFTDVHVVQHAAVGAPQSHDVHEVARAAFTGQSLAEKGGPLRSLAADTRVAFHRVHRSEPAQHVDETAAQLGRAGEAPRETLLSGRLE